MEDGGQNGELHDLEDVLDRLEDMAEGHEQISVGMMLAAVGRRSFGPMMLVAGIVPASPLSGIPVLPTVVASVVVLLSVQLVIGRSHFWLPSLLLNREVSQPAFVKAMHFMRPIARFVDRFLRPRLRVLTTGPAVPVIATLCVLVALTMPPLEIVPFGNAANGTALSAFGLALLTNDGVLALAALFFFGVAVWMVIAALMAI